MQDQQPNDDAYLPDLAFVKLQFDRVEALIGDCDVRVIPELVAFLKPAWKHLTFAERGLYELNDKLREIIEQRITQAETAFIIEEI